MNTIFKDCKECNHPVPYYRIDDYCSEYCINKAVKKYVATYNYGNKKNKLLLK